MSIKEMKKLAVVLPINNAGEILLQLRDKHAKLAPDHWGLIGGHIEDNESSEDAVKREIKEEINAELDKLTFLKKLYI